MFRGFRVLPDLTQPRSYGGCLWAVVQLSGGDILEGRFALLEGGSTVDDELLKLKSDMMSKGSYTAPALPQKSSAEPRMYDVEPRKYNVDIYWP
jgi:hypothetical protein